MSSSSSSSYRRYNQDVSNKTYCDCKPPHPIPIQTAWTTDNPGRRFRGCPIRDKSKKCGVYGFLGQTFTDYDYWNTWVQDESTDEEDEDEVMTTKDDDLLFYQDTFPVDKFVPYGKAMGSKRIEKSPTIPGAVLGLCNTLTWVEIEKKLRKKPPMKH
ncbi:hypothetical protein Tco_1121049 [Tanacetum coccineum]|uniref:Zinc finger GRF-type domain-containing protein n=1 Tax=Tanacetum coccineum TaxID=301880 RepID=A0ABQ5J086_9ASTR